MKHLYLPVGSTGELLQRSDLHDINHENHPFGRPNSNDRKVISIWDVDGTITSDWIHETTGLVYDWMCRSGYASIHSETYQTTERLKATLLENPNEVNRRAYYTAVNIASDKIMKLLSPEELQLIARRALIDAPIHEEILPEIERVRGMGIPILLASGTPSPLLHGIADEVGAHFIIGTHFPQKNGRYDPNQETISRGRGKGTYLRKYLGGMSLATLRPEEIENLGHDRISTYDMMPEEARINVAFGAGNTAHDQDILDLAADKLVVDGDEALLKYAGDSGARTITTANSARQWLQSVSV